MGVAPLRLNTTAFLLENPTGSAPKSLKKHTGLKGIQLPCTVITLNAGLSGDKLHAKLAAYSALKDDG